MLFKFYKLKVFFVLFVISINHSYASEIVGKAITCDASEFSARGYPFFFYFDSEKKFYSYLIMNKKIRFHNFDYKQINTDIYDLSFIGFLNKDELVLTYSKYNTKCLCNILDKKKKLILNCRNILIMKNKTNIIKYDFLNIV